MKAVLMLAALSTSLAFATTPKLDGLDAKALTQRAKKAGYKAKTGESITDPVTGEVFEYVLIGDDGAISMVRFSKPSSKRFAWKIQGSWVVTVRVDDGPADGAELLAKLLRETAVEKLNKKEVVKRLKSMGFEIADSASDRESGEVAYVSADRADDSMVEVTVRRFDIDGDAVASDGSRLIALNLEGDARENQKVLAKLVQTP